MNSGVSIEQVKQYNKALEGYRAKSAQLKAEIEVNNREIQRICSELSAELGTEVTPDNIKSIYEEQVKAINNSLNVGMSILERIKEEEQIAQEDRVAQLNAASQNNYGRGQFTGASVPQAPNPPQSYQAPVAPQAPVTPPPAPSGALFGMKPFNASQMAQAAADEAQESPFSDLGGIPPIFNNNI